MKGLIIVVAVLMFKVMSRTCSQVSVCLKTMLKIGHLPLCCYPFIKQPIKNQCAICLPFVTGWMLLHSLRERLTLPPLFHKPSSSPRGEEFRVVFVAIIVTSSPGSAGISASYLPLKNKLQLSTLECHLSHCLLSTGCLDTLLNYKPL